MDKHGFLILLKPDKNIDNFEKSNFVNTNIEFFKRFRHLFSEFNPRSYKGISRDVFDADTLSKHKIEINNFEDYEKPNIKARIKMFELLEYKIECDLVDNPYYDKLFNSKEDAVNVYTLLDNQKDYELIEIRRNHYSVNPRTLGFDIGYWGSDSFSLIADTIITPKWHPANEEDYNELKERYKKLNENLLFKTPKEAEEFKYYYKSKEWAEKDYNNSDFIVIQIDSVPN
jgi:hypothetical protein